jgi:predicted metalloprotease with PDZ domain
MNGYKLVYTDEPTGYFKKAEKARGGTDVSYSLGLSIGKEGNVSSVVWDSPAFASSIDVGSQIVGVGGETYSPDRLKAAIVAAKGTKTPIRLLVKNGERLRDIAIDYHDGPRYPRLQKTGSGETGLDKLLAPR